jgi:hypothetical protein
MEEKSRWGPGHFSDLQRGVESLMVQARLAGTPLDISGLKLPQQGTINLQNAPGLIWREGILDAPEVFAGCHFDGDVLINNLHCRRGANFVGSEFRGSTSIGFGDCGGAAAFDDCVFAGDVRITQLHTSYLLTFDRAHFKAAASLNDLQASRASLVRAVFNGEMSLDVTTYGELSCEFMSCKDVARLKMIAHSQGHRALLSCVRFDKGVDFRGSKFKGGLICDHAGVGESVRFDDVEFCYFVDFRNCHFGGEAWFAGNGIGDSGCFPEVHFNETEFLGRAVFNNRHLTSTASFEKCRFSVAPEFHGARIHQAAIFPSEMSFLDVGSSAAAHAYRTLKLAMEQNRSRREEAMFFALEQRSLRNAQGELKTGERWLSTSYDELSRYGQDMKRPFLLLAGLWFVAGISYAAWSTGITWPSSIDWGALGRGLAFSLEQLVNPFGVWRSGNAGLLINTNYPIWLEVAATIQSLLSAGLAALFFLALRWRFKRE